MKAIISNVYNKLCVQIRAFFQPKIVQLPVQPPKVCKGCGNPISASVISEIMRLRRENPDWSARHITRVLERRTGHHVALNTVIKYIRDWKPSVAPLVVSAQQAPAAAYKPPALPVVASKPPAPVPVVQAAPPEPLPDPIHNSEALLRRFPWLKDNPTPRYIFLVNGKQNMHFATNNSQLCVAIEQWHAEYRNNPIFQAERIWVVLNAADDNVVFLHSLVNDIGIRERCLVTVGSMLQITQSKFLMEHPLGRNRKPDFAVDIFERAHNFQPMPQSSHVQVIESLLRKPTPAPESPLVGFLNPDAWRVGGSAGSSAYRSSGWRIEISRDDDDPNSTGGQGLLGT